MKAIVVATLICLLLALLFPQALAWETERPSDVLVFDSSDRVEAAQTDAAASIGVGLDINTYVENWPTEPFSGRDGVELRVVATANTRKGIEYGCTYLEYFPIPWVNASCPTGIVSDDSGAWLDLAFPVFFYGGPGYQNKSAYYRKIWISSNGFMSFDSTSSSSSPKAIPDPENPNTLLAAYWSDLDPSGGDIKYYSDQDTFVVMWYNVLNKRNGARQTFEVIIENFMVPGGGRGQNRIRFLYKSVTWSDDAVVGIEDQEGCKGTRSTRPSNGHSLIFTAMQEPGEIRELTIELHKSDSNALVYFDTSEYALAGYNLKYTTQSPQAGGLYDKAISGYTTLLASTAIGLTLGPVGGIMFGVTRVGILELAPALARAQWPAHQLDRKDAVYFPTADCAYINASAENTYDWPVDALLSDVVRWVFTDQNTVDHTVTVTAKLKYYSYSSHQIVTLSTKPLTLTFLRDAGNVISEAKDITPVPKTVRAHLSIRDQDDYYKFNVSTEGDNVLNVDMTPASTADFDLEVYSCQGVLIGSSYNRGLGASESIRLNFGSYNNYFYVRVYWISERGLYNLTITISPYNPPGGGGGAGDWPPFPPCLAY